MEEILNTFGKQLTWEPVIENMQNLKPAKRFVVAGMGGSALSADLLRVAEIGFPLVSHKDYGLPKDPDRGTLIDRETLIIASSYSGNTEETLDVYGAAKKEAKPLAAISSGGALLEKAANDEIPFIKIPEDIPPRLAIGYSMQALCAIVGLKNFSEELKTFGNSLKPENYRIQGEQTAEKIFPRIPLIYSSERNKALGYLLKILFNENSKLHAFSNVFPEFNHNEIQGFDKDSDKFAVILLLDKNDHPRIQKRMEAFKELVEARGFPVFVERLPENSTAEKIFLPFLTWAWASNKMAELRGVSAEGTPTIEEFKKKIA